jgi:hypothetical protein
MKAGQGGREAGRQYLPLVFLLGCVACTSTHKTSTGRTERETDSVIGQSTVPGAPVVKKAMDSQDSARARAASIDTAAANE